MANSTILESLLVYGYNCLFLISSHLDAKIDTPMPVIACGPLVPLPKPISDDSLGAVLSRDPVHELNQWHAGSFH